MSTHHRIITGDSRCMSELAGESIHLVVTSPPYWQLKNYGTRRQIGFYDSYQDYINNLNLVWAECFRVLHKGCRLCINIGDQYARSVYYGRYKVIPIRTEIIKFCETIGLDYMGAIIWQKVSTTNTSGGATIMGSFPYPRNGIIKIDYEFILIFKKQGKPPAVSREIKEQSKLSTADWNTYFTGHWKFAGAKQVKHLAMFPLELPHRLIRMFSFIGDTILDPFLGSGTTSLAAGNLNRNSIGYELHPAFAAIIKNKLKSAAKNSSSKFTCEFLTCAGKIRAIKAGLAALPYRFIDPHKLTNKRVGHKAGSSPPAGKTGYLQKNYGSKTSLDDPVDRTDFFRISEVISPEKIKLNNGSTVGLLGITEDPLTREQAIRYLRNKTKGHRIYLKFDQNMYTECGNLLAYVYLQNRTFLNAHLIKSGLVSVDSQRDYKFKEKFSRLSTQNLNRKE